MSTETLQSTIAQKPYLDLFLDKENNIIVAQWKGYLKPDQLREGMSIMLNEVKKHGYTKHISDQTRLKVLSKEVQDLLTEQELPAMEKAGLKKTAVLTSEDIFAKATVDKVNRESQLGNMTIKSFNAYKDCADWCNE